VEVVNLSRATLKEAEEFKKFLPMKLKWVRGKWLSIFPNANLSIQTFLGALVVSLKKIIH